MENEAEAAAPARPWLNYLRILFTFVTVVGSTAEIVSPIEAFFGAGPVGKLVLVIVATFLVSLPLENRPERWALYAFMASLRQILEKLIMRRCSGCGIHLLALILSARSM